MSSYSIEFEPPSLLRIGFSEPANNDQIVRDANTLLDTLIANSTLTGGELIRVNGPASLPVAMVLAHRLCHLYQAVACWDPKLGKYVVAIAHGNRYEVGDLID